LIVEELVNRGLLTRQDIIEADKPKMPNSGMTVIEHSPDSEAGQELLRVNRDGSDFHVVGTVALARTVVHHPLRKSLPSRIFSTGNKAFFVGLRFGQSAKPTPSPWNLINGGRDQRAPRRDRERNGWVQDPIQVESKPTRADPNCLP
jgi:hypothetical protein